MIDILKTANKVVGLKQGKKAVMADRAKTVFVAEDADLRAIEEFVNLCNEKEIELVQVATMKELGKACHIQVPTACAVLLKD